MEYFTIDDSHIHMTLTIYSSERVTMKKNSYRNNCLCRYSIYLNELIP